jgi:hypothetical protein
MLAINVQETTTTTGTGNITLSGASEFGVTFASEKQVGEKFTYYISDRSGNDEAGIGYLSASTTLVREHVEKSSNSDALVNFAAGTKQVFIGIPPSVESDFPSAILSTNLSVFGRYIISSHWATLQTGAHTASISELQLTPFINQTCANFTSWAVRVKTSAVGGVARLGVYQVNPATGGPTGFPLMESDDIDCSSTSNSLSLSFSLNTLNPLSSKVLPKVFFLGVAFNDSTIRLQAQAQGNSLWMLGGNNATLTGLTSTFTMGTPTASVAALPDLTSAAVRNEYGLMAIAGFNND